MVMGAGVGLASSWWGRRQARRAAVHLSPKRIGGRAVAELRGRTVAAAKGARSAMVETEARLRRQTNRS